MQGGFLKIGRRNKNRRTNKTITYYPEPVEGLITNNY